MAVCVFSALKLKLDRLVARVVRIWVGSDLDLCPSARAGADSGRGVTRPILEWRSLSYWLPPSKG